MSQVLKYKKLVSNAKEPKRGSNDAVGYDLCATRNCLILPHTRQLIGTGLSVKIPEGHYGRIASRSGIAFRESVDVCAGVIDPDYRGEVNVLLHNADSNRAFHVKEGERIAQLILERCSILPVEEVKELDVTDRGDGGFGSTGRN